MKPVTIPKFHKEKPPESQLAEWAATIMDKGYLVIPGALPRETSLVIITRSGLSLASRGPVTTTAAQVLPTALSTFDRSVYPGKEYDGYRFYAAYGSGFVLDFSPSQPPNLPVTIR